MLTPFESKIFEVNELSLHQYTSFMTRTCTVLPTHMGLLTINISPFSFFVALPIRDGLEMHMELSLMLLFRLLGENASLGR